MAPLGLGHHSCEPGEHKAADHPTERQHYLSAASFRDNTGLLLHGDFCDFLFSRCSAAAGSEITDAATSRPLISTPVWRCSILTLDLAFNSVIKRIRRPDSRSSNMWTFLSVFLSSVSILRVRFQIRSLSHMRTAATTNAPTATGLYSTAIRRQSLRIAVPNNSSYSTVPLLSAGLILPEWLYAKMSPSLGRLTSINGRKT
jgi:hypothetical protein